MFVLLFNVTIYMYFYWIQEEQAKQSEDCSSSTKKVPSEDKHEKKIKPVILDHVSNIINFDFKNCNNIQYSNWI